MKFSYPSGTQPLEGFTIKRGIGIGGFGEVYFAISDAGKEVALKKIQRNMDIELRGVRHCLNLKHINLISLWDIRTNGAGENWVVMEYVPGKSLRDVVEDHPHGMPELEIKKWLGATAAGVAHLHKHGIVHRDLKPANIFRDDDEHVIKIGDYGLSKFISCNRRSGHTESVGTFHYMAPEIGNGAYGKEIDIYALGIIFYEMLTGDVPFDGESSQEIIMKHLTANVRLEKVPPAFHRVIGRALEKDPHARFRSVGEMLQELPWNDLTASGHFIAHPITANTDQQRSGAFIEPLFVSGDSMKIVRPDIVFGPLNDSNATPDPAHRHTINRATAPHPGSNSRSPEAFPERSALANDPIQIVRTSDACAPSSAQSPERQTPGRQTSELRPPIPPVTKTESLTATPATSAVSNANATNANANASRLNQFRWWWTDSPGATSAKLLVLGLGSAIALSNATALVGIGGLIGLCFLVWFMIRHKIVPLQLPLEHSVDLKATHPGAHQTNAARPSLDKRNRYLVTVFGVNAQQLSLTRRWLMQRSWRERLTEFLGSLLIASLSCIALNLLAMAVCPRIDSLSGSDWVWAWFAWLTSVSIFSCAVLLTLGKLWEYRPDAGPVRRAILVVAGLLIGIAGWSLADFFRAGLDADLFASAVPAWTSWIAFVQIKNIPTVPAWLFCATGLFGVLRWWHQVDPARKTRLSLKVVCLCFVWALIFSYILGQAVTRYCVLAIVVSISLQLAAPRISFQDRRNIYSSGN